MRSWHCCSVYFHLFSLLTYSFFTIASYSATTGGGGHGGGDAGGAGAGAGS